VFDCVFVWIQSKLEKDMMMPLAEQLRDVRPPLINTSTAGSEAIQQ